MCDVPVFYATNRGHTRVIAERVAQRLRSHGLESRAIAISSEDVSRLDWDRIRGTCLAASVHLGKHQAGARAFARLNHERLSKAPSLFVSVSLAAASTNPTDVQAAHTLAERFPANAGWRPTRVASVAGQLAYTQYNWLVRWVMCRIAKKEGASTDTSRDHVYTDWPKVDELADQLATAVLARGRVRRTGQVSLRAAS